MAKHRRKFRLCSMCRVLRIQRSGYYAWKAKSKSKRNVADESLLVSIKESLKQSWNLRQPTRAF
jgi:putative transposase